MVDPSGMDDIYKAAEKRYKTKGLKRAGNYPPIYKVPTGSPEMDLATFGGFPMNRMVRPWGGFSSAKSMSVMMMVKQAQDIRDDRFPDGMHCVWYDVEGTFDPTLARKLGVDLDKIHIMESNVIEDVSRMVLESMPSAHIHVIDTVAHCYAKGRQKFDIDDYKKLIGIEARTWTPLLKEIEDNMDTDNMIVLIDQVRKDIGGYKSEKEASSTAFDHASSLSLHHNQRTKLYRTEPGGPLSDTRPQKGNDQLTGGHKINGIEIEIEVNKSKVCKPFGKARLKLDLDTMQFDRLFEYQKAGIFLDTIKQSGSYFYLPGRENSIQGEAKLKDAMLEDPSIFTAIDADIKKYIDDANRV